MDDVRGVLSRNVTDRSIWPAYVRNGVFILTWVFRAAPTAVSRVALTVLSRVRFDPSIPGGRMHEGSRARELLDPNSTGQSDRRRCRSTRYDDVASFGKPHNPVFWVKLPANKGGVFVNRP